MTACSPPTPRSSSASATTGSQVVLYHIPQFSAVPITLPVIERLRARYPSTFVGIKDSSGDLDHMTALVERFPGFSVLAGADPLMLPLLEGGGAGCITATSNLVARDLAFIFRNYADPARAPRWRPHRPASSRRGHASRNSPRSPRSRRLIARRPATPTGAICARRCCRSDRGRSRTDSDARTTQHRRKRAMAEFSAFDTGIIVAMVSSISCSRAGSRSGCAAGPRPSS